MWKVVLLETSGIENDENTQKLDNLEIKMEGKLKTSVEWQYILWTNKSIG